MAYVQHTKTCQTTCMSKVLDEAIEHARTLSDIRQNEIGEMILHVVDQEQSDAQLTPDQQSEVRRRLSEPHPVVATQEQLDAFFQKFAV